MDKKSQEALEMCEKLPPEPRYAVIRGTLMLHKRHLEDEEEADRKRAQLDAQRLQPLLKCEQAALKIAELQNRQRKLQLTLQGLSHENELTELRLQQEHQQRLAAASQFHPQKLMSPFNPHGE